MSSNFTVYNASAGSGKTYTIVKEYLKIILSNESPSHFKHILAVTFTNKAAGEMKQRVFITLNSIKKGEDAMLIDIANELNINIDLIKQRAQKIATTILHDYSKFNISTIDKFTHKLIRTFSHDLGLPLNFEVEMDYSSTLNEAVDMLISKVGTDKELTKAMVDFTLRQINDEKSWDVSYSISEIGKELFNEESSEETTKLKNYSIKDFVELANNYRQLQKTLFDELNEIGEKAIDLIDENNIKYNFFSFSDIPKYFIKCINSIIVHEPKRTQGLFDKEQLYSNANKKKPEAEVVDGIFHELLNLYNKSREWTENNISFIILIKLVLKNIDSITVLNELDKELQEIKTQNNILFNSEFNKILSEEISTQPTAYIYERIGDKFQYFFVDEFQDTSVLQWKNLLPLINNSIATGGNCVIVGDGKQAIYRWRGGKAEQFIDLSLKKTELPYDTESKTLDRNYRSYSEIVNFSNDFFKFCSSGFTNNDYAKMYIEGNEQKTNHRIGGYIEIDFINSAITKEFEELQNQNSAIIVADLLNEGYKLRDICILTRNNKQGISVSNYLIQQGYDVVSKESLLLKNNPEVDFIVQIMSLINSNDNFDAKLKAIDYLISTNKIEVKENERHYLYNKFVKYNSVEFFENLKAYNINVNFKSILKSQIIESVEEIIREFELNKISNTEIQFFLDFVLEFSTKNNKGISAFLEKWHDKKEKLSLIVPEGVDAVQVMTIHKSKGLEFPIVIFPYANWDINDRSPKKWIPLEGEEKVKTALIPISKDLEQTNFGSEIYRNNKNEVALDNLNMLYVAMTRPVQRLYIITDIGRNKLSEYFDGYLNSNTDYINANLKTDDTKYIFGKKEYIKVNHLSNSNNISLKELKSYKWKNRISLSLEAPTYWEIGEMTQNEWGKIVHNVLADVITKEDIDSAITKLTLSGNVTVSEIDNIKLIVENLIDNKVISKYFSNDYEIKNEQDILIPGEKSIRPDRVAIKNNLATIIDYKTGLRKEEHTNQINTYADALTKLGYIVENKILVYLNDELNFVSV
ncbi:MAG: UvrD-helicase domain-containing protein [Ichthyobacteriaceae bacterium]|nr:UvrD-helicase domain-containing protein [Ichthyobacteriaceae bacterium]